MKLKYLLSAVLISIFCISGTAQAQNHRKAHSRAHKEQLANRTNKIDKSVISDLVANDIQQRESLVPGLSHESAQMLEDLMKEGNKHLGKRYSRGSKGPNAFDCSGFTSYVYRQFGYNIGADSRIQYANNKNAVNRNELRKGDLVFFSSRGPKGTITHVGIVTSANNETGDFNFIHASTSRGIIVSSSDAYYNSRYVGARRVITE